MAPSFAAPTSMPWESPRDTWVLTSHRQPASRVWALDTLPPAPRPRHDSGGKTALATPLPRAPRPSWSFPTARYAWRLTSWCWVREPAPQGEESHG